MTPPCPSSRAALKRSVASLRPSQIQTVSKALAGMFPGARFKPELLQVLVCGYTLIQQVDISTSMHRRKAPSTDGWERRIPQVPGAFRYRDRQRAAKNDVSVLTDALQSTAATTGCLCPLLRSVGSEKPSCFIGLGRGNLCHLGGQWDDSMDFFILK